MDGDAPRRPAPEPKLRELRDGLAAFEGPRPEESAVLGEIADGFRLLFAGSPLPMWVIDRRTAEFLAVNEAAARHYGYTREQFLRLRLSDVVAEEYIADVERLVATSARGTHYRGERRHRCSDGREIVVDVSVHGFDLANRSVELVVVRDITAQKQAERLLRELNATLEARVRARTEALHSTTERLEREAGERRQVEAALRHREEQFRGLAECAPMGIFLTDVHGRCVFTNARWQEIAGLSLDQSLGDGWANAIHPDDHALVLAEWSRAVDAGVEFALQFRLRRPGGEVRWVNARAAALRADSGEIMGYVGTDEDVTERRQIEAALAANEQQFQQIANNIDQVLWLATLGEKMQLYVSPAYEVIWGRSRDSLYASPHSWVDAIHPDDREHADLIHARHRAGEAAEMEYRVVRPDGSIRWVRDRGFPIVDADGIVRRVAGVADDVTEQKDLAAKLQQARLAEARLEGVTLTARELAHRINNALAPLSLTIEMLQAQRGTAPAHQQMLQSAMEAVDNIACDIEKLHKIVRVETWQTPVGPSLDLERSAQWTIPR